MLICTHVVQKKIDFAQVDIIRGYSESQQSNMYGMSLDGADTLCALHMHGKRAFDKSQHLERLSESKKVRRALAAKPENVEASKQRVLMKVEKDRKFCDPLTTLSQLVKKKCCEKGGCLMVRSFSDCLN